MKRRTSLDNILSETLTEVNRTFTRPERVQDDPWNKFRFAAGDPIYINEVIEECHERVGMTKDFNAALAWTAGRAYKERLECSISTAGEDINYSILAAFDDDGRRIFHS